MRRQPATVCLIRSPTRQHRGTVDLVNGSVRCLILAIGAGYATRSCACCWWPACRRQPYGAVRFVQLMAVGTAYTQWRGARAKAAGRPAAALPWGSSHVDQDVRPAPMPYECPYPISLLPLPPYDFTHDHPSMAR